MIYGSTILIKRKARARKIISLRDLRQVKIRSKSSDFYKRGDQLRTKIYVEKEKYKHKMVRPQKKEEKEEIKIIEDSMTDSFEGEIGLALEPGSPKFQRQRSFAQKEVKRKIFLTSAPRIPYGSQNDLLKDVDK